MVNYSQMTFRAGSRQESALRLKQLESNALTKTLRAQALSKYSERLGPTTHVGHLTLRALRAIVLASRRPK